MSINVTVTGNPVSIRKGRMVTASPNHNKKEFEKRRLIRLSQVRQQSKDIAENVRNKVRKEKQKQVEEIEKEGQKKLKQWQTRKLLELQNQYHDALRDIGKGHKQASLLECEEETLSQQKENNVRMAKKRAAQASQKLREQNAKLNVNEAIQKRKLVRVLENKRSGFVTSTKKYYDPHKRRKRFENLSTETDVSGIVTECEETDSEKEIVQIDLVPNDGSSKTSKDEDEIHPTSYFDEEEEEQVIDEALLLEEIRSQTMETRITDHIRKRNLQPKPDFCESLKHLKSGLVQNFKSTSGEETKSPESDKIPEPAVHICTCASSAYSQPNMMYRTTTKTAPVPQKYVGADINRFKCSEFTDDEDRLELAVPVEDQPNQSKVKATSQLGTLVTDEQSINNFSKVDNMQSGRTVDVPVTSTFKSKQSSVQDIPSKPKVTLRSMKVTPKLSEVKTQSSKTIEHFDYNNKFKQHKSPVSQVEKIEENSLILSPNLPTQIDIVEKMRRRDKEAQIRGQKAVEKERIHREYNELMRKLPALQKLERLYEINQDKPEYHMSEERLKDLESKKQNILDNKFEKLFPDRTSATVTIPPRNLSDCEVDKMEVINDRVVDNDSSPNLNLNIWNECLNYERNSEQIISEAEAQELLNDDPGMGANRTQKLKDILFKLRHQREELLKEIEAVPCDSRGEADSLEKLCNNLDNDSPHREKHRNSSKLEATCCPSTVNGSNSEREALQVKSKLIRNKITSKKVSQKIRKTTIEKKETDSSQSGSAKFYNPENKQLQKSIKLSNKSTQINLKSQKYPESAHDEKHRHRSRGSSKCKAEGHRSRSKEGSRKRRPDKEITSSSELSVYESDSKITPRTSGKQPSNPSTQFPRKRLKMKTKQQPLNNSLDSRSTSEETMKAEDNACVCKKHKVKSKLASDLCEIVIKIKEGNSTNHLKPNREGKNAPALPDSTNLTNKVDSSSVQKASTKPKQIPLKPPKPIVVSKELSDTVRSGNLEYTPQSWHDKLSKHSSNSTSSTSYMSPPTMLNTSRKNVQAPPPYFGQLLGQKPQQQNINEGNRIGQSAAQSKKAPDLFFDVKKLLCMSRLSIDELGVSSVSNVSTPAQSIIDLDSNTSRHTIEPSIKPQNVDVNLQQLLSYSPDITETNNRSTSNKVEDPIASSENDLDKNIDQYPEILAKYAKIAEKCSRRISNLSAMIEKIRDEKNKMLQSSCSVRDEKENSTTYMDLPSPKEIKEKDTGPINSMASKEKNKDQTIAKPAKVNSRTVKKQSSSSEDDDNLLDIDFSFAEKLKKLTPVELKKMSENLNKEEEYNSRMEDGLAQRLKQLKEPAIRSNNDDSDERKHENINLQNAQVLQVAKDDRDFVPILSGLPRPSLFLSEKEVLGIKSNRMPPPSKGLLSVRMKEDAFTRPHELSTIPEVDSLTKIDISLSRSALGETDVNKPLIALPQTNEDRFVKKQMQIPDNKRVSTLSEKLIMQPLEDVIAEVNSKVKRCESTSEELLQKSPAEQVEDSAKVDKRRFITSQSSDNSENSGISSTTSSDEKLEMYKIEAMLRSIGMDWAVATLRKTQETLALTSSSSSLDLKSASSSKDYLTSSTDVREFLSKHLFNKISSSTLKSDASPGSLLNDTPDVSVIHSDGKGKKTSTPIYKNKLQSSKPYNNSITPDSSIQSVISADKNSKMFYSLSEPSTG